MPAVSGSTPPPGSVPIGPPPTQRPSQRAASGHGPDPTGGIHVQLDSVNDFDAINSRPYIRRLEPTPSGPPWGKIAAVVVVFLLIVGGIAFVSRLRSVDTADSAAFGGPGAPIVNPTVDQLAQASVQILGLDSEDQPLCSGSGTFVSRDGFILTNAHVITSDPICDFTSLGIAVTVDAGRPPELRYRAEVLAVDAVVDLAVLHVTSGIDPAVETPTDFPALALGDSDQLGIGDDIRILGYPEIGGETITFTNGSVSGFTAQAGIGDRALIKTDATIAGGNSGGAAVDAAGRLIGIPTKARASESGPAVDCRPLADTNGDGEVDEADNCVPIGGFLNGIRPINLALALIEEARSTPASTVDEQQTVNVDLALVEMSRPRFSRGQVENTPTEVIKTAEGGISQLCLFVDWRGVPDGVEWDGLWWYNGEIVDEYSLVKQTWGFGADGANFWMCAMDSEDGLRAGLYETGFFLDGQLVFAEGIVLTDGPGPVLATTWENVTDVAVCALAINPEGSGQVGLNELPAGRTIDPGGTIQLDLPGGASVVEAFDCEGNPIADSAGTLMIQADRTYTIERPPES